MKTLKSAIILGLVLLVAAPVWAQAPRGDDADLAKAGWKPEVYKKVGEAELKLWIRKPEDGTASSARPAIVFFYGGGWQSRNICHFKRQGEHLVKRGMIAILPDYRSKAKYGGSPFDCVEDAKSAMRYVRKNAKRLGIDPDRIAAGGGSAGGHLAAATAMLQGLNAETDDPGVSCVPNALVLFNPVYDNGPQGYGYERVGERYPEISPYHNIRKGAPPTIVFLGSKDDLIPVKTAEDFEKKMKAVGSRCETHIYQDVGHSFFNLEPYLSDTIAKMDSFLESLGYLAP